MRLCGGERVADVGRGSAPPGSQKPGPAPVSCWISVEARGAGAMLPEACRAGAGADLLGHVPASGGAVLETGLSQNAGAFQQMLSMRLACAAVSLNPVQGRPPLPCTVPSV